MLMMRMFLSAPLLVLAVGAATAETVRFAVITKVDDKAHKITANVFTKKGEEPTEKTFSYKKGELKVYQGGGRKGKGEKKESTLDALTDAIANSKSKFKGVFASLEVEDGKVTEITYRVFKGKKKKKKPDDAAE